MSVEPKDRDAEGREAATTAGEVLEAGQRVFNEAVSAAKTLLADATRTTEKAIKDGVETLKAKTKAYSGPASRTVDDARRHVVERMKERPVTAALAGLGAGFLLGVLLSSRGE